MASRTDHLEQALRTALQDGTFAAGGLIPSERALCERFRVSRTTVRRALGALVEAGRLVRRPGAGTYAAETPAAATPDNGGADSAVACIVPTLSHPLYGDLLDGIEQEARACSMHLITGQSNNDPAIEAALLRHYRAQALACGLILVPARVDRPSAALGELLRSRIGLVFAGRWPGGLAADGVGADYPQGGDIATAHLIALGHRRIAYAEGVPHLPGFSPGDGYRRALLRAGIAPDPALERVSDLAGEEAGAAAIDHLLERRVAFTAVVARNDVTASGVVRALHNAGLHVPDDVSVASIDNSRLARFMVPPLTSADPFPVEMGRQAFRLLKERLRGTYAGPARRIVLNPTLVIRDSTAPPANRTECERATKATKGVTP